MWHLYNLIREVRCLRTTLHCPGFRVRPRETMCAARQYGMILSSRWRRSNSFPKPCAKHIRNRVLRIAPRSNHANAPSNPSRVHPTNHSNIRSCWGSVVICARRTDSVSSDYGTRRGGERARQDGRLSHARRRGEPRCPDREARVGQHIPRADRRGVAARTRGRGRRRRLWRRYELTYDSSPSPHWDAVKKQTRLMYGIHGCF